MPRAATYCLRFSVLVCASAAAVSIALAQTTTAPRETRPDTGALKPAAATVAENGNPFELPGPAVAANRIDELVFGRLRQLGLEPAHVCSDAVFIRRAFVDVIGTLPTADEVRSFLTDRSPRKRETLIDRLLTRDEYADYWTMKWCDLLRVKAEFPINLWPNAAQEYHRWIFTAVRDNLPYDQFARALLTSNGSNFRVGPVNFFRAAQARDPQGIARVVALTWLGCRADKWSAEQRTGMASFFSSVGYKATQEWKEEIVFFDSERIPASGIAAVLPDGTKVHLGRDQDPRVVFADWLTGPGKSWLARAYVNRAWAWMLGRGIVDEPDDLRPDNPPTNPELLQYLEQEFVAGRFDTKRLLRLILNSRTYQLSSISRSDRPEAAVNFASYPMRRLEAEVLIDALNQITGTTEKYSSAIPEPYTFIPESERAIALPDGSITSSFLEMFGRPGRDTGEFSERNDRISASQRLHLLNSTQVQRKLEQGPKLQALFRSGRPPREIISELYLRILSRQPTDEERRAVQEYAAGRPARVAAIDLAWALINSAEFLYRH